MIELDIRGRRGGKTHAMLEAMRQAPPGEHRICVCASRDEAMRLLRDNPDLESWQFVSLHEVMQGQGMWSGVLYGRGGHIALGLDNLDLMLEQMLHWPVYRASWTDARWRKDA